MSDLINKVKFEVLIDDLFSNLNVDASLAPIDKKRVLSVINDFEEGEWRYPKFQNFIWDNIKETALSAKERANLVGTEHSLLINAAKKLRLTDKEDKVGKGSELAEIVLYGIMKNHYGALPVVPKIFYKQNSKDNAKGADSVHIVIKDGDFTLWFGEAKFYNDIQDARLASIITSVCNSLNKEKIEAENSVLTNINDLKELIGDDSITNEVVVGISAGVSLDSVKKRLNIPILLLHECAITKAAKNLTEDYRKEIISFHKDRAQSYFSKQIKAVADKVWMYDEITFHIILFPVPCKSTIVDRFMKNVEFYKEQ